jgi:homocysteine S-methyltransferase
MLPQLERTFLTDGGMETDLIFNRGIDLPEFASIDLLKDSEGKAALRAYYEPYIELARERGLGFIYGTPTWRASPDWGELIGYSLDQLGNMIRAGVALGKELRDEAGDVPVLVSGTIGPQGDGYAPDKLMSADEAQRYHAWQIGVSADAGVDMVDAMTMTYPE